MGVVRRRLHRRELQCKWAVPPPGRGRRGAAGGWAQAPVAPTRWETGQTDAVSRIVAGHYSAAAEGYRSLWAPELLDLARRLLDELPLTGARRLLDSGAGVGSLLPELATRSASALVFGVDVSEGMVALTPPGFPAAVADSCRLPFDRHTFDVGILAFVLFHLPDPIDGLKEMSRVLRPGGTVGTITWGPGGGYRAREVWLEALDEHGAAAIETGFAKHELVDSVEKIQHLLERSGFEAVRTWIGQYESRLTPDEFLAHRTGHGESRRRFESLGEDTRAELLRKVRLRLLELGPEDFVHREAVVYATSRTPQYNY
ncbi:MAG: class I SAM-dependent methyltransferase [Actinomycetota bacterium]